MTDYLSSLDNRTFDKLRKLYIFALSTIAISVVISQVIIRNFLNDQQNDSTIINIAGRQRMLSQKLTKQVLLLSEEINPFKKIQLKNNLRETLDLWETSHNGLLRGNNSLGLPGNNSATVIAMYQKIESYYESILNASNTIIEKIETNEEINKSELEQAIELIKKNENYFLLLMDAIVNQYNFEASKKVDRLRNLELILMALTLVVLLGEFIFIFWPSAKFVKSTIRKLLNSEKRALKSAYDADLLRENNEKSVKELRTLNQVMDRSLLFTRILADGSIIHIGEKFSRLFNVSHLQKNLKFSEIISINKNEQEIIEDLITSYSKIGWQGEVKGTKTNKESIWLEMYIIPFYGENERLELLIISSDITKRKQTQLELENLTEERYQEKMSQQKVISSKIVENQEKEQNRIAKDIHDGIGQMLTGLKFNLESVNPQDVEKTTVKVEFLKTLVANIILGVRTATFNLAPPELGDYGIVPALTNLTQELNKYTDEKIEFFNKTNFNKRLDSLVEINIYRITQEAINNAIKYAQSSHIIVRLSHRDSLLSITIDDNGIGFEPMSLKNGKKGTEGMGMMFTKERISYINGRFFVNSSPKNGTRITINIPFEELAPVI